MSQGAAIALTVVIIAVLLVVFFVSFVAYRRTPKPKGCEDIPDEETCNSCKERDGCVLNLYRESKAEENTNQTENISTEEDKEEKQ